MKSAKKSNKGKGRRSEPSVLDYFSKSKRKKTPRSTTPPPSLFGTPATPTTAHHHLVDDIHECRTPASVVSNESRKSSHFMGSKHASRKNVGKEEEGTPDSCLSTGRARATLDTHEPNTPPPSSLESCIPNQKEGERDRATKSAQTSETPPSNDMYMTTPPSPPTPNAWSDCTVEQMKKFPSKSKLNRRSRISSNIKKDDVRTPQSLLETKDSPAQNDSQLTQLQNVDMGTPSTACTPSTSYQSNIIFRNYSASSTSSKSPKTRKMDQSTCFSKPIKKQKQSNQLFLDFGQNSFGKQTICNICGMLRVHGMEEDDTQHAKICKEYKEGVSCLGWKNERRVATFGRDDRILEVRPDDAQQYHKKVLEVKAIVDKELGFANRTSEESLSAVSSMTSYMYISKKRVVGLVVVKRIRRAYELLSSKESYDDANIDNNVNNSSSISRSLKSSKALLGIYQIWVHNSHRSRGIASKLVTAARDHLIFGMVVPLELVAFSSPTDAGLRFAKRYIGSEKPLIFDIH